MPLIIMRKEKNCVFIIILILLGWSNAQTAHICEGQTERIACSQNSIIRIKSALYGRISTEICPASNGNRIDCRSSKSMDTVQRACEGKESCSLSAVNTIYGDPCTGVYKYLEVQYLCFTANPCEGYFPEDDYQRSTAYVIPSSSKSQPCDRTKWVPGWYRFTSGAGGMMPMKCPPENSCGSKGSIWLGGTHPAAVGEEATMEARVRVAADCNAQRWNVKVRKCSKDQVEYYVYYLLPPTGCPMRYCAGDKAKCEDGESSSTGFEPCSNKYPKLKTDPVVTVGVKDNRMQFTCKIDPKDKGDNIRRKVTWYRGPPEKQIEKNDLLSGDQTEAYLRNNNAFGEKPLFCLGQLIYCKVESYFGETPSLSETRKSNEFFAGFKIEPKEIDLSENAKPKKIRVTTTVPLICQDGTENCEVLVELGQTKVDNFIDYCTINFKPGPAGQSQEIEVVAKRDFVDDGDQTMFLKIHIPQHVDPVDWNCHQNITDVKVTTKDVKTARCTSTGDPHITTFDNCYYNHFSVGDYLLVKSSARMFEVHVRTFRCHTVSCNCGIAAREGDDVVVIDMCRDNVPRARFASTVQPQKGTVIERNENGKSFVVNFPSGAFIKFDAMRWFGQWYYANIVVQVPSDDYQNTTGMCGSYDKNPNNDLIERTDPPTKQGEGCRRTASTKVTESYKLKRTESLFYYEGGPRKCLATREKSYCTCQETCCGKRNVNCDFQGYSERPKYKQGMRGWKTLEFPGAEFCGKRRRRRRAVENNIIVLPDDGNTAIYEYNPDTTPPVEGGFPTKSGKTEIGTRDHCTVKLQGSSAGKACLKLIKNFDISKFVDGCVTDVKISDDLKLGVDSAINSMTDDCEEITLREINTYWKKDPVSNVMAPPQEIGNSVCPNECSGNGICTNATCICEGEYITSDCSLKKGQAPTLIGVPNNGLCDIRRQDCVRTRVTGYDFIDSVNLKCKMTEVITGEKPLVETGHVTTSGGDLLSFAEISCHLPYVPIKYKGDPFSSQGKPTGGYYITVSNDGESFSHNKTLLLVYDSKCMNCTLDGYTRCLWKEDSCKINNYCFAPGDANPRDWCQVCNPKQSRTSFVKRTVNLPPTFKSTPTLHAFKGQVWKYDIPASDPEEQILKYEFIGSSNGMMISSAGILTWFPTENSSYIFTVKVTDPCGLFAQYTFTVVTHLCICEGKNDGICVWKGDPATTGVGECKCPSGCRGDSCTEPIDGRVCRIRVESQIASSSSKGVVIALVIVFILLILVAAIFGYTVYYLKTHKQPVTTNTMKNVVVTSLGKAYNSMQRKKDDNYQMKFGGVEPSSKVNEGYRPN